LYCELPNPPAKFQFSRCVFSDSFPSETRWFTLVTGNVQNSLTASFVMDFSHTRHCPTNSTTMSRSPSPAISKCFIGSANIPESQFMSSLNSGFLVGSANLIVSSVFASYEHLDKSGISHESWIHRVSDGFLDSNVMNTKDMNSAVTGDREESCLANLSGSFSPSNSILCSDPLASSQHFVARTRSPISDALLPSASTVTQEGNELTDSISMEPRISLSSSKFPAASGSEITSNIVSLSDPLSNLPALTSLSTASLDSFVINSESCAMTNKSEAITRFGSSSDGEEFSGHVRSDPGVFAPSEPASSGRRLGNAAIVGIVGSIAALVAVAVVVLLVLRASSLGAYDATPQEVSPSQVFFPGTFVGSGEWENPEILSLASDLWGETMEDGVGKFGDGSRDRAE